MIDTVQLRVSFAEVARHGDRVPLYFYSTLFVLHPEIRQLFPTSMAVQRDRLFAALGRIVSDVDNLEELESFLAQLGRDHRMFSVAADHYPAIGAALLATLEKFLGDRWTSELAAGWREAYGLISSIMIESARVAEKTSPPWWEGEVIDHEKRSLDVAVLQLKPDYMLPFKSGQSLRVETSLRPRLWRYYSPANAPRPDGTIELHVRRIDGGQVSSALVGQLQVGDILKLGAPIGNRLTLEQSKSSELLLIAGGTGLAPLKALVEQIAVDAEPRRVTLVVGAQYTYDLYDLPALNRLSDSYNWLTVLPAVSKDSQHGGASGTAAEIALDHGLWHGHEIYVCGPVGMVKGTVQCLLNAGIPSAHIHYEDIDEEAASVDIANPTHSSGEVTAP